MSVHEEFYWYKLRPWEKKPGGTYRQTEARTCIRIRPLSLFLFGRKLRARGTQRYRPARALDDEALSRASREKKPDQRLSTDTDLVERDHPRTDL
jgi:hypothetical protein